MREVLALRRLAGKPGLANADITFLTDDTKLGRKVVDALGEYRVRVADTFAPDWETADVDERPLFMTDEDVARRRKMAFFLHDARVKATTLHSFKGWESPLIVLHVSMARAAESRALVYAGLTRLKRSAEGSALTVVCSAPELEGFGAGWPDRVRQGAAQAAPDRWSVTPAPPAAPSPTTSPHRTAPATSKPQAMNQNERKPP